MTDVPKTTDPTWTEGVCGDGAVFLRDGVPVPISGVLAVLNAGADEIERLRRAGWIVCPPGHVPMPRSRPEAEFMKLVSGSYLASDWKADR